ncbi:MAG TPA: hypothetical protein VGS10_02940 [Terracidiphilus sp.]|nr:hypothetical protein [Terracidiphilus sp.]
MLTFSLMAAPAFSQAYKVIERYKLPGNAVHGLAIDSKHRRLFVADSEGLLVLNPDTGDRIGMVGDLRNVQDVLLLPASQSGSTLMADRGYATDQQGSVIAFSATDLKATKAMRLTASGPATLCYDDDDNTVEAVSSEGTLSSIDASTGQILGSGKVPAGTGQIACGNLDHVYVADPAANVVHVLNHRTLTDEGDYPMQSGRQPSGVALDTKGRRLFVTCENGQIEIVDTDAGFIFIELKAGSGSGRSTFAWLPQGKGQWKAAVFSAQQDGTLAAVRMNAYINYSLGSTSKLGAALQAVAWDEKTHHLYLAAMDAGSPVVLVAGY